MSLATTQMPTTYRQGSPVCCNPNVSRFAILLSTIFFFGASLALLFQKPVCPLYTCKLGQDIVPCPEGSYMVADLVNGFTVGSCAILTKASDCPYEKVSYIVRYVKSCDLADPTPANAPFPCPPLPSGQPEGARVVYVNTPEIGPACFSRVITSEGITLNPVCGLHPDCLGIPAPLTKWSIPVLGKILINSVLLTSACQSKCS